MFALLIFPGRPSIVLPSASVQWTLAGRKNSNTERKNLHISVEVSVFALPIFPGSRPPSIVGADELNFCVRDGNRWTLIAINTNYISVSASAVTFFGDPYRIRTDVNGVRGRCLNHLTNGPLVQLQGLEPGTH